MKTWVILSSWDFRISFKNIRWDIAEKRISTLCFNCEFISFFEDLKVEFFDEEGNRLPSMQTDWQLSTDGQKVELVLRINRKKTFRNVNIEVARIRQIESYGSIPQIVNSGFHGHPNQGVLRVKILNPKIYSAYGSYKRSKCANQTKGKFNVIKHILSLFK